MPSGLDILAPCEDRLRWDAVTRRDEAAGAAFVYAVRTTGVYCRPTCPARLPHRENVVFYATSGEAERAGFRACKRCKPDGASQTERHAAAVTTACRLIAQAEITPKLAILAKAVAMSPAHFHRLFVAMTGLTPKAYGDAKRAARLGEQLDDKQSVTAALHAAGYGAASRLYETAEARLGMTPTAYRAGGAGTEIRFAVGACSLGAILVAATIKGICAILMGDDPAVLIRDLEDRFDQADLVGGDSTFEETVAHVIGFVEAPRQGLDLPLDIRGTAFQERVWRALRAIPAGTTASYSEVAQALGQPNAVRAVARACAANAIAVAIPCHRVVRIDGALSGYRWGVERKRALLARETPKTSPASPT